VFALLGAAAGGTARVEFYRRFECRSLLPLSDNTIAAIFIRPNHSLASWLADMNRDSQAGL
jgi:hypothetical protein